MFWRRSNPTPYGTPGNPAKGHVGRNRVLDDGSIYAWCACGWSATKRSPKEQPDPRRMLSDHLASLTNKRR